MPIFEYICSDCDHRFEVLLRGTEAPHCPTCSGDRLAKQLSVFAVNRGNGGHATTPLSACGSCGDPRGPGACSLN